MHYDTAVKNRAFGCPNMRVWKSISKDSTQLEQIFIVSYCLLVTLMFTVQFTNVPEFNIPHVLLSISKLSVLVLQASVALCSYLQVLEQIL